MTEVCSLGLNNKFIVFQVLFLVKKEKKLWEFLYLPLLENLQFLMKRKRQEYNEIFENKKKRRKKEKSNEETSESAENCLSSFLGSFFSQEIEEQLLFFFQILDDGFLVDITQIKNEKIKEFLHHLLRKIWKFKKKNNEYRKKGSKNSPSSCLEWFKSNLEGFKIQRKEEKESQSGPQFNGIRKKKKKDKIDKDNRTLLEIHRDRKSTDQSYSATTRRPVYDHFSLQKEKKERKKEERYAKDGETEENERKRLEKIGYLTFDRNRDFGPTTTQNQREKLINSFQDRYQEGSHSSGRNRR